MEIDMQGAGGGSHGGLQDEEDAVSDGPEGAGNDDVLCTVCYQDLSSGAFKLEEHPTVPGVVVCPRCLENLREVVERKGEEPEEEICAWCGEDEDKKLFLCDGDDCGRAFCDHCIDKLGKGTAAGVEASDDQPWLCPCCDESLLAPLQAVFTKAENNPPLLSRVLARLGKEELASETSREEQDSGTSGDGNSTSVDPLIANPSLGAKQQLQQLSVIACSAEPRRDLTLTAASSAGPKDKPLFPQEGASSVGGAVIGKGGEVDGVGATGDSDREVKNLARQRQEEDKEEDAFAQELIDAAIVVESEIANTLEQMDFVAIEDREKDVSEEIRRENPGMPTEDFEAEVSAEMERVREMWQYMLDALLDVQPVLKEALGERSLSETGIFVKAGGIDALTKQAAADGPKSGVSSTDEEDEEDKARRNDGGGILEHFSTAAAGTEPAFNPASDLLLRCHDVWEWLLLDGDSAQENGSDQAGQNSSATPLEDVGDVARIYLGLRFFVRAMEVVNKIQRVGVHWNKKTMKAAAEQGVKFFQEGQANDVDRPSAEDINLWGLTGDRTAQLGIIIRWIKTRLATYERTCDLPSRFDGEEDSGEKQLPSDREALVLECKLLERHIKAVDSTWDGSATEDFWTTASDKDLKGAWHNLKLKRHSASGEADNMALVLLDRAGNGGICDEELQVEDLGTSSDAYLRSSRGKQGYSAAKASRMLQEAVEREGDLTMQDRSEAEDKVAVNKERRKAVTTGFKPRRPRAPRVPRLPRAPKAKTNHKASYDKEASHPYSIKGGGLKGDGTRTGGSGSGTAHADLRSTGSVAPDFDPSTPYLEPQENEKTRPSSPDSSWAEEQYQESPKFSLEIGVEYMTQAPLSSDLLRGQNELQSDLTGRKCDRSSGSSVEDDGARSGEVGTFSSSTSKEGTGSKDAATKCTVEELVVVLNELGLVENEILMPERRTRLESLLRAAMGNKASAVGMFLEREKEDKAQKENCVARIATLRTRSGPRGSKCYVCSSTMHGEWKRMRKVPEKEGLSIVKSCAKKTSKTDKAKKNTDGGGSGGGVIEDGEGERGCSNNSDFPVSQSHGFSGNSAVDASCSDASISVANPLLKDDETLEKSSRDDSNHGRGGGKSVSGGREGRKKGKTALPKVRNTSVLVKSGGVIPDAVWICGQDYCLEVAKGARYVVDELYTVQHVVWTAETELGPDRLATPKKNKATTVTSRREAQETSGEAEMKSEGSRSSCGGFREPSVQRVVKEEEEEKEREKFINRKTGWELDESTTGNALKAASGSSTSNALDLSNDGADVDNLSGQMPVNGALEAQHAARKAEVREAEAREACAVVLGRSLPSLPTKLKSTFLPSAVSDRAKPGGDGTGGTSASIAGGSMGPNNTAAGRRSPGESGEMVARRKIDEESSCEENSECTMNNKQPNSEAGKNLLSFPGEGVQDEGNVNSEGSADPKKTASVWENSSRVSAVCKTKSCSCDSFCAPDGVCRRCRVTGDIETVKSKSDYGPKLGACRSLGCTHSADGYKGSLCRSCREKNNTTKRRLTKFRGDVRSGPGSDDTDEFRDSDGETPVHGEIGGRSDFIGFEHAKVIIDLVLSEDEGKNPDRLSSGGEGNGGNRSPSQSSSSGYFNGGACRASPESKDADNGSILEDVLANPGGKKGKMQIKKEVEKRSRRVKSNDTCDSDTSAKKSSDDTVTDGEQAGRAKKNKTVKLQRERNTQSAGDSSNSGDLKDTEDSSSSSGSEGEEEEDEEQNEPDENSDEEDVLFLDTKPGRRRIERPLDKQQEQEVASLAAKERERLKRVAQRSAFSPPKAKIRRECLQSPRTPMKVEKNIDADQMHILEEVPAGAGESENEVVAVAPFLGKHLLEHQVEGVQFMYDNLVVNTEQLRDGGEGAKGNGCILAHCMGLGKTLQAIAIIHVLLTSKVLQRAATVPEFTTICASENPSGSEMRPGRPKSSLRTCLVLVPKNVLRNWQDELKKWLVDYYRSGKVFVVDSGNMTGRLGILKRWHKKGGILVMSYSIFRNMVKRCEDGDTSRKLLQDPGPDVVVADEAHLLKNEDAQVTIAIKKMRTKRRVALTGSPLQNNLVEYYTMVDFVRRGMLGNLNRFKNYFEAPILNGMLIDSSPYDVKKSHGRSHVLHETLRGFVLRKDVTLMAKTLPAHVKKEEIVIMVALTKEQKALTLKIFREAKVLSKSRVGMLMKVLSMLQLVWTHPLLYEEAEANGDSSESSDDSGQERFPKKNCSRKETKAALAVATRETTSSLGSSSADTGNSFASDETQGDNGVVKAKCQPGLYELMGSGGGLPCDGNSRPGDNGVSQLGSGGSSAGRIVSIPEAIAIDLTASEEEIMNAATILPNGQLQAVDVVTTVMTAEGGLAALGGAVPVAGGGAISDPTNCVRGGVASSGRLPYGAAAAAAPKGKKRKITGHKRKEANVRLQPLDDSFDVKQSAKMVILLEIIAQAVKINDKVIIFSQRKPVLNFIERVLMTEGWGGVVKTPAPTAPGRYADSVGSWGPWYNGKHYFRLDGSTSSVNRQRMIKAFNSDSTTRVFLLSTKAGNMGINLVAANRVVLLDTSWNPANDLQAMFRCYRFGQTKPVEVYRLVVGKSLENKMHNKQITKHALAGRVVDARNPGRNLTLADQTVDLDAEYSRYAQDGDQPGGGPNMSPVIIDASAVVPVSKQDAENMPVGDDKLAAFLGIGEGDEGNRGEVLGHKIGQQESNSTYLKATGKCGSGGNSGRESGDSDMEVSVGLAPSAVESLPFSEAAVPNVSKTLPQEPESPPEGTSGLPQPTCPSTTPLIGARGLTSSVEVEAAPNRAEVAMEATILAAIPVKGIAGAERHTKVTVRAERGTATGAKIGREGGKYAAQDPVLAHLIREFHPEFIGSWVTNKHLLEDDPLDKLNDADKAEATRQYDEDLKLDDLKLQGLKDLQAQRLRQYQQHQQVQIQNQEPEQQRLQRLAGLQEEWTQQQQQLQQQQQQQRRLLVQRKEQLLQHSQQKHWHHQQLHQQGQHQAQQMANRVNPVSAVAAGTRPFFFRALPNKTGPGTRVIEGSDLPASTLLGNAPIWAAPQHHRAAQAFAQGKGSASSLKLAPGSYGPPLETTLAASSSATAAPRRILGVETKTGAREGLGSVVEATSGSARSGPTGVGRLGSSSGEGGGGNIGRDVPSDERPATAFGRAAGSVMRFIGLGARKGGNDDATGVGRVDSRRGFYSNERSVARTAVKDVPASITGPLGGLARSGMLGDGGGGCEVVDVDTDDESTATTVVAGSTTGDVRGEIAGVDEGVGSDARSAAQAALADGANGGGVNAPGIIEGVDVRRYHSDEGSAPVATLGNVPGRLPVL